MERSVGRRNDERRLGANTLDQVDGTRVDITLVLVRIVLVTDRDSRQRRALLTEECDDLTSVDTRDGRDSLTGAPLAQALNRGPVAVLGSHVRHNDTSTLDMGGLEVLEEVELVTLVGRNAVVADEGLGEDEDLTAVGGVGHGLGVSHERGGEDGLTRDVGVGSEGSAMENRSILNKEQMLTYKLQEVVEEQGLGSQSDIP